MQTRSLPLLLPFVLAMALGACTPGPEPSNREPLVASPQAPTDIGEGPQPAATSTEATSPTVAPSTPKPVRTELEATDPATVSLAGGQPTLVEFFAFW